MNVHEIRVVSRHWNLRTTFSWTHRDTQICQLLLSLSHWDNAEISVLLLDSLHFTMIDLSIAFSSSCWNVSDGWLHRTIVPPPFLGTDSDFVSFKIQTEWAAVSGMKLLYENFYRKHREENTWKLQETLMDLWKCLIIQRSSTWIGEMPTAFLLLCSQNAIWKKKICRVSSMGTTNMLMNCCNWLVFFHWGFIYIYYGCWSCDLF